MATRRVFAGRWPEKRYKCTCLFISIIKLYNAMTSSIAIQCGTTGKSIFS